MTTCTYGTYVGWNKKLWLNTHFTSGYVANKVRSVAAHEIGHYLGLAHRSGSICVNGTPPTGDVTLMNPYTSTRYTACGVYTPIVDDRNGVNYLY